MSLGRRLKARLEEKALAPLDLAQACGVTRSAVYQWFSGDIKNLRPENLVAASDLLGVHIRWLVLEKGPKERGAKVTDLEPEEADLLREYRRLEPGQKEAIRATVGALVARERKKRGSA